MTGVYYNEIEPYAAQWLRNLMAAGLIPAGEVDTRSIADVCADDVRGFTQCHFFAGIGGWAYAARLAGWPDDRPLWTGSCPCQPFSVAGHQRGADDARHLWPDLFRLTKFCRPPILMGEQVAAAVGRDWFDGMCIDLEAIHYTTQAAVVPACAVNAPHRRDRLWFVTSAVEYSQRAGLERLRGNDSTAEGRQKPDRSIAAASPCGYVANPDVTGAGAQRIQRSGQQCGIGGNPWALSAAVIGHDGKARRVKPGVRLLAHGIPNRVGRLRAYGNAIVPQVAAHVIGAYMDTTRSV